MLDPSLPEIDGCWVRISIGLQPVKEIKADLLRTFAKFSNIFATQVGVVKKINAIDHFPNDDMSISSIPKKQSTAATEISKQVTR
jgi:hypothetical protein